MSWSRRPPSAGCRRSASLINPQATRSSSVHSFSTDALALSERLAREAAEVKRLMAEADEQRQRQEWERAAEIRAQQAHASSGIPAPLYQGRAHTPRRQRGSLTPTGPGSPLPLSPARSPATRQPLAAALMAAAHTESPRPKTKRPVRKKQQAQPQPEPEPEPRKEQRTPAPKTPKSPSRYSFPRVPSFRFLSISTLIRLRCFAFSDQSSQSVSALRPRRRPGRISRCDFPSRASWRSRSL